MHRVVAGNHGLMMSATTDTMAGDGAVRGILLSYDGASACSMRIIDGTRGASVDLIIPGWIRQGFCKAFGRRIPAIELHPERAFVSAVPQRELLTDRERDILRLTVESFIDTAGPVGSRTLARRYAVGLSPASIRNTMSDLEEKGYLDHPYTSAGRVPTERGYRAFVDELMAAPELSPAERHMLRLQVEHMMGNTEELLRESSRLLGSLSNLLGVVLSPRLSTGVLERLEIVPLSSARVMFVLSVRGGLVKTIVLECKTDVDRRDLDRVVNMLNERLAGSTLAEIRETYARRIRDVDDRTGIVRLVLDKSSVLFAEPEVGRLTHGGAQHILGQPEFQEPDDLRRLIELLEDEHFVVHLLEDQAGNVVTAPGEAAIRIGREHHAEALASLSLVTARYRLGDTLGTIGVLGPTRMDYSHVVALVEGLAQLISSPFD